MRVLVGNHIDPSIRDRGDLWAWTQRVLWFARAGDLVVLCAEPDAAFLAYATGHTGIDQGSLRVLVPPPGRHGGRLLDPASLTSDRFVQATVAAIGGDEVSEVFALWPSSSVARFAAALGLADRYPGAAFFAQGGGELANSKAMFRALAAGAGAAIPTGEVVRSPAEAIAATTALLHRGGAVVVKQAHNGAGVGNQLLITDKSFTTGHVGARHTHLLDDMAAETIATYWQDRWNWASAGGRFPVVIEEYVDHVTSVYSEHYADDDGTHPTEAGELFYVDRRLSHQIVPFRALDQLRVQLSAGGTRLADTWRALGFRGHLSADAVVTPDGRVVFTEVNAQVSGSLHIYDVIAHQIVNTAATPERSVVEYHVPPSWAVPDFATFLAVARELGRDYDPATRTGVIVSMPAIPLQPGRAQFVFCVAYADVADREAVLGALDARFASIPTDAYDPSDHIGRPTRSTT